MRVAVVMWWWKILRPAHWHPFYYWYGISDKLFCTVRCPSSC